MWTVMVLHADEAVCHRQHEEIVPHGNVRVMLEKTKAARCPRAQLLVVSRKV